MAALMADLGIMERALQLLSAAGRRAGKQQAANRASIAGSNAKLPNNTARATPRPVWMVTEARVTECRNELVRASALTLRITNDPNKLTVSFTYYAHAQLYYGNFISLVVRAQGETFSVYYNALNPSENTQSSSGSTKRSPASDIAMLGVILISILALSLVRG
jgi:CO/xanthine dehydrogenase FAD-binding subunit